MAETLCKLSYSELNALSSRLDETAETVRNPSVRADITQARLAISDLSGRRFLLGELATKIRELNVARKITDDVCESPAAGDRRMTNTQLHDLARRLRNRAVLCLDSDTDAAHDLLMASYCLDHLRCTRIAVDAMLAEATAMNSALAGS
jgi:hypothetical protein